MGMTHVTSGKLGYYDYNDINIHLKDNELKIKKDIIIKMLKRENELRLSSDVQLKYKQRKNEGFSGFVSVTEELQKQVVKEFNLNENNGLKMLRCAPSFFSTQEEIEEIKNISLYRKYNRLENGNLSRGDNAPNVELYDINGEILSDGLLSLFSDSEIKPLVLIAGSIT